MELAGAIIGHLVGDYLLQNDWMAKNKTSDSLVCAVHCTLWTAAVAEFGQIGDLTGWSALVVGLWLFGTHFLLDRFRLAPKSMRYTGQLEFFKQFAPWAGVMVDNTWHLVTIWVAWRYLNW